MTTPRVLRVVQALAMLGSASLLSPSAVDAQTRSPERPCPRHRPANGSSCEGFAPSRLCEWRGLERCQCGSPGLDDTERHPSRRAWRCMTRTVPGPLAPPELA